MRNVTISWGGSMQKWNTKHPAQEHSIPKHWAFDDGGSYDSRKTRMCTPTHQEKL